MFILPNISAYNSYSAQDQNIHLVLTEETGHKFADGLLSVTGYSTLNTTEVAKGITSGQVIITPSLVCFHFRDSL